MSVVSVDEAYQAYHLSEFERKIGFIFHNRENLVCALTNASFKNENVVPWKSNGRLEFLGDSVLQLVLSEHLYHETEAAEGILTDLRQKRVNDEVLAEKLKELHVNDYLLIGKGERPRLDSLGIEFFANFYEAIVGAIYLDTHNLENVRLFIQSN